MKRYDLIYITNHHRIEKHNITREEVQSFLDGLRKEDESSLKITEVKERDDEER